MSKATSLGVAVYLTAVATIIAACSSAPITLSLSPSLPQGIDEGQTVAISATVVNSSKGVSWSLSGPGSLVGATPSSVVYAAPANVSSAAQVRVTATVAADSMKTAFVQITVNPNPQIPFQSLPNGSVGSPYNQTIALTGGTPPFQWSVYNGPIETGSGVSGAVPDGLTLNTGSGAIGGTPTGGGTWYFEATVTDATGVGAVNGALSIQINPTGPAGTAVPFLNQPLAPTAVSPGSPSFLLSVSGAGFAGGATVDLNRVPLATTFVDSEHLVATVPAADVASAGTAAITVVNPAPGGGASNVVYLQVGAPEAAVSFANAKNSPLTVYLPVGLAIGDFNEDGKPDLAVAGNIRIYLFLGNGDGTFTPVPGSPLYMPSPPYDDFGSPYVATITAGDFTHAGHTGLVVGSAQNEAAFTLAGSGNGAFAFADTPANAPQMPTTSVAVGDFNGDGDLDLVAIGGGGGASPITLLGYGHGAFNDVVQVFQDTGSSSAVGDFNNDGKLDLTIDGAKILLGVGDGTFTQAPLAAAGDGPVAVAVGDFNGDGNLDLAVCDNSGNNVTILLGNGNGTFTPATGSPIPVGNQPYAIVAGDFNNDGNLDLAVANYGDGTVSLLLGNGNGTFTQASGSPYAVGNGPYQIAAADFNGDGKLDLAVANLGDGTVSILLQQ